MVGVMDAEHVYKSNTQPANSGRNTIERNNLTFRNFNLVHGYPAQTIKTILWAFAGVPNRVERLEPHTGKL